MRIKQLYFVALAAMAILPMAAVASAGVGGGTQANSAQGVPIFTADVYEDKTYVLPQDVGAGALVLLERDADPLDVRNWSDVAVFNNDDGQGHGSNLTLFSDIFDGTDDPTDYNLADFYNSVLSVDHEFILESTAGPTVWALGAPQPTYIFHSDPSEPSGIPEPGSAPMTAMGLLGLGAFAAVARRKS